MLCRSRWAPVDVQPVVRVSQAGTCSYSVQYGPVGWNVCTARNGVGVCGVKNALQTWQDRKSWRIMVRGRGGWRDYIGVGENAEMLGKMNTIMCSITVYQSSRAINFAVQNTHFSGEK